MANARQRLGAHEGLRELNARELTLVSGGYRQPGTGGGFFDINGSDWYQNNPFGRLVAMSRSRTSWVFM